MHTEGEYTIQDDGEYGMWDKMYILAPDGERVATVDILDASDVDHAHKIRDLLNAANMTTDQAVKYLEHGPVMKEFIKAVLTGNHTQDWARRILAKLEVK